MRFLPLPNAVYRVVAIALFLLAVWLIWGSWAMPETLWAPGNLSSHHNNLESCNACHLPFRGASSDKCADCHKTDLTADQSASLVAEFHPKILPEGNACLGCHIEHRGQSAQITVGSLVNPHGEFVFQATGTRNCESCHDFSNLQKPSPHLVDNAMTWYLYKAGEGAHKPGKMAACIKCHNSK